MQINTMILAFFSAFILCGLSDTQHSWPHCDTIKLLFKLHYHRLAVGRHFSPPRTLPTVFAPFWEQSKVGTEVEGVDWVLRPDLMEVLMAPYPGDYSQERSDLQGSSLRTQSGKDMPVLLPMSAKLLIPYHQAVLPRFQDFQMYYSWSLRLAQYYYFDCKNKKTDSSRYCVMCLMSSSESQFQYF